MECEKTKVCARCNSEKPFSEYNVDKSVGDGRNNRCRECLRIQRAGRKRRKDPGYLSRAEIAASVAATGLKKCTDCGLQKPLNEFGVISASKTGKNGRCKPCNVARVLAYNARNPGQKKASANAAAAKRYAKFKSGDEKLVRIRKSSDLRRNFGIGIEEYERLIDKQGGGCAICGATKSKSGRALSVDHYHGPDGRRCTKWGATVPCGADSVRGVLCEACNSGIGHFGESVERLESAIAYVLYWKNKGLVATN